MKLFVWALMFVLCGLPVLASAGTTPITFTGIVDTAEVSFGDPDPNDGSAPFTGVYDESGFRVRPNGGTWFVAGDIGDPVGHVYSEGSSNETVILSRLTGGDFILSQISLAPLQVGQTAQVFIEGRDGQGIRLYRYAVTVGYTGGFTTIRLDVVPAEYGSFLSPVASVWIASAVNGFRLGGLAVESVSVKKSGGKRGR